MKKNTKKSTYTPKRETIFMSDCTPCFHPTFGNEKLGGIMGIGYLSGYNPTFADGTPTTDCLPTCYRVNCGACNGGCCYAVRSETRFPNKRKNCIENTMQLREDMTMHFQEIKKAIRENGVKVVRYTESGEIENFAQFLSVYRLARKMPDVRFYLYTKNYEVLSRFFESLTLPNNMVVLISVWNDLGLGPWEVFKKYRNVKCFAVNAENTLRPMVYCPAYFKDENGKTKRDPSKTCEKCRLCFDSKAKIIGCLEH